MTVSIIDAAARDAFAAATAQQAQCEAIIAAWAGGNVTARVLGAGGVLRQTVTLGPWTIAATIPREVRHGARLAYTTVSTGDIQLIEYRTPGGTLIFTATAGEGATAAAVDFAGPIRTLCGVNLSGAAFTAQASLPVTVSPLDATLNIIAAAAEESFFRLNAGRNTFQSQWPPVGLRDTSTGTPSDQSAIIICWAGAAWADSLNRLIIWGGGHANTSANEVYDWSAETRDWRLSFYGTRNEQTDPYPIYRSIGFNDAPVSSHTYGNNIWPPTLNRFFTFGGAAHGDGGSLRVWDPSNPSSPGGLRKAGAFTLDMAEAGTGKTSGATGSMNGTGASAGINLVGANAWTLRDWFSPAVGGGPSYSGTKADEHINRSAMVMVEGGKDVVYYTANGFHVWRAELNEDPALDTNTLVGLGFVNTNDLSAIQSLDPVRRIMIGVELGNFDREQVCFVDLKRTFGATECWQRATLTGPDAAEFRTMNKNGASTVYNPTKGCFTFFLRSQVAAGFVWEIYPPNGNPTPTTGWTITKRAITGTPTAPSVAEADKPVHRKWLWAGSLGVGLYLVGEFNGEIWAYKPTGWVDPRT